MKNFKIHIVGLLLVAGIFSCNQYDELLPEDVSTTINSNIIRTNVSTIEEEILEFEIDLFLANSLGNYITLKREFFEIDLTLFETIDLNVELMELECSKDFPKDDSVGPYSASILIDQSGSMLNNDAENNRVAIGKKIIEGAGPDDEVAVTAFAGTTSSANEAVTIVQNFTMDKDSLYDAMDFLIGKTGGGTPLFNSLNTAISQTIANASNPRKAVIILTDEGASDFSERVDSLLCLVRFNEVKVHTVSIKTNPYTNKELNTLVVGSNGVIMNTEQGLNIPSLESLMNNEYASNELYDFFYRTSWRTTKPFEDAWNIGDILRGTLKIKLSDEYEVSFPFKLLIC